MSFFRKIGPATIVTAAFIGPGTVTLCTIAGASFGYSLLWALLFSVIATIVLQEMSARLGVVSGKGLGSIVRKEFQNPAFRILSILLIFSAIVIGNLAYEAGNITGTMLGLGLFFSNGNFVINSLTINYLSLIIGCVCFTVLYIGSYRSLEKILFFSVAIMSLTFLTAAIASKPSLTMLAAGLLAPAVDTENILTIVSLIGTTIVPYNLFLHSALVAKKWNNPSQLASSRLDTTVSVSVGGIISMCIVISAASMIGSEVVSGTDLVKSIEPVFGRISRYFIGLGLLAAGISSAITAPLAAAIVASECFSWDKSSQSWPFRAVWMSILIPGALFSSVGFKPIELIKFAQVVNGILLPVIAGFLLILVNRKSVMYEYTNSKVQNTIGIIIFIVTVVLGTRSVFKILTIF